MMTNLNVREQVIGLTKEWDQERFEDGRPRVPDEYLEILRGMTLEEVWLPLYIKGYRFQFEGSLNRLHPAVKMVGRAVTCTFVPARPDLCKAVKEYGEPWLERHLQPVGDRQFDTRRCGGCRYV